MRNKRNSTILLIVLVIVAFLVVPGQYGFNTLSVLRGDAGTIRDEASTINADADRIENEVLSNEETFAARETAANTAIPEDPKVADLINTLSSLARENNLEWVSGSPTTGTSVEGLNGVYNLDIQLRSTTEDENGRPIVEGLGQYLDSLRELDRLVVVDAVNLSPTSGTATLQARFFSQEASSD